MFGARESDKGQAAVELALVLPLLTVFTIFIAQFAVVARDQLAIWQLARETARDVALSMTPSERADQVLATLPEGSTITIDDSIVTVALSRRVHMSIAGFGFIRPTTTLRAGVSMALEPGVAFDEDVGNQMR